MRIHEYGIKPDHSYWSGFIPYSVKGASDQNSSVILCCNLPDLFDKQHLKTKNGVMYL